MMMNSPNEFTQKDLMKHLLDRADHAATREELQSVQANLNQRIDSVRDELKDVRIELKQDIADVRTDLRLVASKQDRMQWAICGTIIVSTIIVLFKEQILAML